MAALNAIPRLISIPLLLVGSGLGSFLILALLERVSMLSLSHAGHRQAEELARQRTRLIATFLAINLFFWFSDPSLGAFGGVLARALRYGLLALTAIWMASLWNRSSRQYRREATSASLRKQLRPFLPQLEEALDGRLLVDLSADEVFILAKGLPAQVRYGSLTIYRNVLADLFRSGRLDRSASFLQLEELRQVLQLGEEDHHAAIRELAVLDPALLHLDARQRQARDVRESAASEAIADLLHGPTASGAKPADLLLLYRQQLEKIRRQSGLDGDGWTSVLSAFLTEDGPVLPLIKRELDQLEQALADRLTVLEASGRQPLLRPLLVSLDLQMVSVLVALLPQLLVCSDRALGQRFEQLRGWIPASVSRALRDRSGLELSPVQAGHQDPPFRLSQLVDVLAGFWQDPDPETAAWAQWLLQRCAPARAEAVARQPRPGLPGSRLFAAFSPDQTAPGGPLESQLRELINGQVDETWTPAALLQVLLPKRAQAALPGLNPIALLALPSS
jgi:hypothetical protein